MATIFQMTYQNGFSWMKTYELWLKISRKFVPEGPINNIPVSVQIMAWRRPGDKPLSETMMVILPTHKCITRPQWVNGFGGKQVTCHRMNIQGQTQIFISSKWLLLNLRNKYHAIYNVSGGQFPVFKSISLATWQPMYLCNIYTALYST